MVNVNKLKGAIVEREMSVEELAKRINVDKTTLYRKLKEADNFTIGEADKIAKCLGLTSTEANAIFFAQYVA